MAVVIILLASITPSFASDGFSLFPVQKIFFSESNVNQEFVRFLASNKTYVNTLLNEKIKAAFPSNIASTIDDNNKYKTFIVSAYISRASRYDINKPDGTIDIYLPITLSINFTNMLTGEVIYSYSYTNYSVYTAETVNLQDETFNNLYRRNLDDLTNEMLSTAKKRFKPFTIETKVFRIWKGYIILDKGLDNGISVNDSLSDKQGNLINVIHAGINYSVAVSVLGTPATGTVLSKLSSQTLDNIKKPRVVILKIDNPDAFPEEVAQQFFSESLGSAAKFSILPIQRHFYSLQRYVIETTKIGQSIRFERELPNYFIRMSILPPTYVQYPTNKQYVKNDVYTVSVFGEMLDNSGRVLYATDITETLEEQVVSGLTFANEARMQVLVKNALTGLGKKFADNVKFNHVELPLVNTDEGNVFVADTTKALVPGVNAKVFRNLGNMPGTNEKILVPIWEVAAAGIESGNVRASKVMPTSNNAPAPEKGDFISMDAVQNSSINNFKRITMCPASINLGGEPMISCDVIARYAVSANLVYPFYSGADFSDDVSRVIKDSVFKKRESFPVVSDLTCCVEPVYKIIKNSNSDCTLTAGLRLKQSDTIVFRKGLEQKISVMSPNGNDRTTLELEIRKGYFDLLSDIAKKVDVQFN